MRILGIDHGEKRIGLAISDETGTVAQPLATLSGKATDALCREVAQIANENRVDQIIVGVPVRLDGTNSKQTEMVIAFIKRLQEVTVIPVKRWDERLTSVQAERFLLAADVKRSKRREVRDRVASQMMLQSYLDATSLMHTDA